MELRWLGPSFEFKDNQWFLEYKKTLEMPNGRQNRVHHAHLIPNKYVFQNGKPTITITDELIQDLSVISGLDGITELCRICDRELLASSNINPVTVSSS